MTVKDTVQDTIKTRASSAFQHVWVPSQLRDMRVPLSEKEHKKETTRAQKRLKRTARLSNAHEQAMKDARPSVREYTLGEEVFNATSHGVGTLLAIAAIPITVVTAVRHGAGIALLAALIFSISMVLEYTASTLYHALTAERAKRVFKVLDHSAIYLLIAGTYTPYCLITLQDNHGILLAALVWGFALLGIGIEAFWTYRPRWISAVIYVVLGWLVVFFMPAVVNNLASAGFALLLAGGICYTIGAIFYVLKKIPYMHSVFHLFVLAGTILQFLSIELYVL